MEQSKRALATLAVLICAALSGAAHAAARFAVVVGNDRGGQTTARLWYAERDAAQFARTLGELGDFEPAHVALLQGSSARAFREALARTESQVQAAVAAGEPALLVVYFSGHADRSGLQLGDDRLPFSELRALVAGSKASVKVAIVDACDAGSLTQVKGARLQAGAQFAVPGELAVEGLAYVASTAAGEAAQESAALGGSFFTQYLQAALRGAGDADGDGKVTLAEAFRYASARTTAATSATESGAQHPTYSFHMSGRGDVVLADLVRAESRLLLPADPRASYVVRGAHFTLDVPGSPAELALALPPGDYAVERRAGGERQIGEVTLARGGAATLPPLRGVPFEVAQAKGSAAETEVFALGTVGSAVVPASGIGAGLGVGVDRDLGPLALRLEVLLAARSVNRGDNTYTYRSAGAQLAALWPLWLDSLRLEAGPALGVSADWQEFAALTAGPVANPWAGGALSATLPIGPLRLRAEVDGALHLVTLDGSRTARPTATFQLGIAYAP